MRTFPLIFLLLAAAQLEATAQSTNLQPYTGSYGGLVPNVSTLQSFPEPDWSWAARRQNADESDSRSLRLNFYYGLTSITIKKGFSAELVTDTTRLVRGSARRGRESAMYYFDEAGRRRYSYKTAGGEERILIIDPQRQLGYLIRPDREDVLRVSGTPHNPISARSAPSEPRPAKYEKQVTTQLGIKEFDGLKASGTLTESFYPPGSVGNEKEMVETKESWSLPQLGITVYWRKASPKYGETIAQYRNIKLGDPPASVFEIPSNFKVRDVTAANN